MSPRDKYGIYYQAKPPDLEIDVVDNGQHATSALVLAVRHGLDEMVEALLQVFPESIWTSKTFMMRRPLYCAAKSSQRDCTFVARERSQSEADRFDY